MTFEEIAEMLNDKKFCKTHGKVWNDGKSCLFFHVDNHGFQEVQINSWDFDIPVFPSHEGTGVIRGYCNYEYDIKPEELSLSDYVTYEKHRREQEMFGENDMCFVSISHNLN